MEINDIIDSIYKLDQEDLTNIVHAVKDRRDYLTSENLEGFRVNDKVTWKHGQGLTRDIYTGTVENINRKTISVKESGRPWSKWRVSPSLLTKIEEEVEK